jgi:hypothetical protein
VLARQNELNEVAKGSNMAHARSVGAMLRSAFCEVEAARCEVKSLD